MSEIWQYLCRIGVYLVDLICVVYVFVRAWVQYARKFSKPLGDVLLRAPMRAQKRFRAQIAAHIFVQNIQFWGSFWSICERVAFLLLLVITVLCVCYLSISYLLNLSCSWYGLIGLFGVNIFIVFVIFLVLYCLLGFFGIWFVGIIYREYNWKDNLTTYGYAQEIAKFEKKISRCVYYEIRSRSIHCVEVFFSEIWIDYQGSKIFRFLAVCRVVYLWECIFLNPSVLLLTIDKVVRLSLRGLLWLRALKLVQYILALERFRWLRSCLPVLPGERAMLCIKLSVKVKRSTFLLHFRFKLFFFLILPLTFFISILFLLS